MEEILQDIPLHDDPTAPSRKRDHIELAFQSQIELNELDKRFYYEPLLSGHPKRGELPVFNFLNKKLRVPIWVSSMTGGTDLAQTINQNLARACKDFGMGMGLGSCRALLHSKDHLPDFAVKDLIGEDLPFYANLGIAQLEQLVYKKELFLVDNLLDRLCADGLIIHVNPLQEWLQPEGDKFEKPPLETIQRLLDYCNYPVIIKEVGQGMGFESLRALLQLPIAAIDFAANGGTNFAKLELIRHKPEHREIYSQLAYVGHSAEDMVNITNQLLKELGDKVLCRQIIISGGIKNFLDGYYLINKLAFPCIYGQASGFLKHARGSYEDLYQYVDSQVQGLELATAFLRIRD